jgi:hypothetical protein
MQLNYKCAFFVGLMAEKFPHQREISSEIKQIQIKKHSYNAERPEDEVLPSPSS